MPISEKILNELNNLDISDSKKQLMRDILDREDSGTFQYTAAYENLIKEYLTHKSIKKGGKNK